MSSQGSGWMQLRIRERQQSSTFVNFSKRLLGTIFALILKGKAAIWHLCPAGNQETAHPFFSQYLRGDMRIAMIAESQKPSTFVTLTRKTCVPRPSYVRRRIIEKGLRKPLPMVRFSERIPFP